MHIAICLDENEGMSDASRNDWRPLLQEAAEHSSEMDASGSGAESGSRESSSAESSVRVALSLQDEPDICSTLRRGRSGHCRLASTHPLSSLTGPCGQRSGGAVGRARGSAALLGQAGQGTLASMHAMPNVQAVAI